MENLITDFNRANERLAALYQTETYRAQCDRFQAECKRLEQLCLDFLENKSKYITSCDEAVVRQEFASGCHNLHRGFYTPSLLAPHMIYGAKRGKLLTRITSRSNPCFEYGFNNTNQLVLCKSLNNKNVWQTEYCLYEQNKILGFTLNSSGDLTAISEEVFENGQKIQYLYAGFAFFFEPPVCHELYCEEYTLDVQGNLTGHWHQFMTPVPYEASSIDAQLGIEPITVPVYHQEIYTIPNSK